MNADNLDVRLLRFRSRREESPHALASSLLEAGRMSDALEVLRLGLVDNESDSRLLVLEGRVWFDQGDLVQAQASLIRAAKANPRDKEAYRWLAQVLMKRGEPARAVQVLERALTIDATDKSLQQAHMRAQRLARIASEAEQPASDLGAKPPEPKREPVQRSAPPVPAKVEAAATRVTPPVPGAANRRDDVGDLRFALDREPDNTPVPRPRSAAASAPPRKQTPRLPDPEPESADDSPTAAYEMPEEIRNWLEAERAAGQDTQPPGAPSESIPSPVFELSSPRTDPGSQGFAGSVDFTTDEADIPTEPPNAAPPAEAEGPEQVLEVLAQQGIFEGARAQAGNADWVPKGELERAGNRLGKTLAVGWALALVAAGGGYYGWTQWLGARRSDARSLIAQAVAEAHDGQNVSLLSAESHLSEARALDPKSDEAIEQLLFVHATRALEDGSGDIGYLRNTLARAQTGKSSPALIAAAKALVHAVDRNAPAGQEQAALALKTGAEDARVAYLVGRLFQRSGTSQAPELLKQAVTKDPQLALGWSGQAELALSAGDRDQALSLLNKALGSDGKFLRAELWRVLLEITPENAAASKVKLDGLSARVQGGSASDKLLAMIARARISRVLGDNEAAKTALSGAATLTVLDPELMVFLAQEASAASLHDLAYRAANAAFTAAPQVRRYRDTLVDVLLQRGDGRAAWSVLADASDGDAWLLIAKARAALLAGARDGLAEAKKSLARYRATPEGREDTQASALLLRADLRLGANAESLLTAARTLGQQAPGSAPAQIALGEAALLAGQAELAVTALERATKLNPADADASYLLGRAHRLAGKPALAKADLQRALVLAPSHAQARETLGGLLVDAGEYDAAYQLFGALDREGAGGSAALGSIEALIGRGALVEAEARLAKLDEGLAKTPAAQVLSARLLMAKGKPAEAVSLLEPLVGADQEARTADVLAVYGDALFASDRVDPAAGAYDAALELDGAHPDALVGRAMAAVRAEKSTEAKALLDRAKTALQTRVRPPRLQAALLITWAKAQVIDGDFEAAKQKLTEAVAMQGAPAEGHFWLAETLAKTKATGASESYAKYLELEPSGYYAARAKKALAPR